MSLHLFFSLSFMPSIAYFSNVYFQAILKVLFSSNPFNTNSYTHKHITHTHVRTHAHTHTHTYRQTNTHTHTHQATETTPNRFCTILVATQCLESDWQHVWFAMCTNCLHKKNHIQNGKIDQRTERKTVGHLSKLVNYWLSHNEQQKIT